MKQLSELTIKEFERYKGMLELEEPDIFGILNLFGLEATNLSLDEFELSWQEIQNMYLPKMPLKKVYKIGGKRYKANLNHLKVKAGQFIDFQGYMKDFKLDKVLSVFLIPQSKKGFRWVTPKYNEGYDMAEVQKHLYENMKMADANQLSDFFLTSSIESYKVMKMCLDKKRYKMMKKNNLLPVDTLG
jgi:hypothetical protein